MTRAESAAKARRAKAALEARAKQYLDSRRVYDEATPISGAALERLVSFLKPYYCLLCSGGTLSAVYKAHRSCEVVPRFDASYFAEHEWRNLSYATERGIVFG